MDGFELTERGKIVIAVLLAVLLLLLPSAFLVYKTIAAHQSQPSDTQNPETSGALPPILFEPTPPVIKDSPPPTGGGFNPPDDPAPSVGSDVTGQDPAIPQESAHNSVDPSEGTLSIFFSPDHLYEPDAEIKSMIDSFLGSPKNTPNSSIVVEIPQLSDEGTDTLMAAIVSILTGQDVPEQRLSFIMRSPGVMDSAAFEVKIYYSVRQVK